MRKPTVWDQLYEITLVTRDARDHGIIDINKSNNHYTSTVA